MIPFIFLIGLKNEGTLPTTASSYNLACKEAVKQLSSNSNPLHVHDLLKL